VRPRTVVLAGAILAGAVISGTDTMPIGFEAEPAAVAVDIKVSLREPKGCGRFADTLPALVSTAGLQPGGVTPTVVVCLRNKGGRAGQAFLSVIDLATSDDACSADEPTVDQTCGQGLAGELQTELVQEYALLRRCRDPVQLGATAFSDLSHSPLPLGKIGANKTRCVALRIAYPGGSGPAEAAAQTDSITWRYAFDLTDTA
jgi:hypothetical protein